MINNAKCLGLLLGNCTLIVIIQLINDTLAQSTISLYPYALFLLIPILLVSFTTGFISVFITGLILDTSTVISYGTTSALFVVLYTGFFWLHQRFKAYSDWHNMLLLQSANAILFSLLTVFTDSCNYSSPYFWISVLLNLFFSQLALLFITPWFLSLQYAIFNVLTHKISPSSK